MIKVIKVIKGLNGSTAQVFKGKSQSQGESEVMSKNRYRAFVDPATILRYLEEPTEQESTHTSLHARAKKRSQVTSVEQLPDGCVLIHVEFKRAKRAGSPAPLGEESLQG